jgi:hypothetical protein
MLLSDYPGYFHHTAQLSRYCEEKKTCYDSLLSRRPTFEVLKQIPDLIITPLEMVNNVLSCVLPTISGF